MVRHDRSLSRLRIAQRVGALWHIQPQLGLARLCVGSMALEAAVRQKWPDLEIKIDLVRGIRRRHAWLGAQGQEGRRQQRQAWSEKSGRRRNLRTTSYE